MYHTEVMIIQEHNGNSFHILIFSSFLKQYIENTHTLLKQKAFRPRGRDGGRQWLGAQWHSVPAGGCVSGGGRTTNWVRDRVFQVAAAARSSDTACVQQCKCNLWGVSMRMDLLPRSASAFFLRWHNKLYRIDSSEAWQMQNCLPPNIVPGALLHMVIWKAIHMYC
jgi:hypothetical protein